MAVGIKITSTAMARGTNESSLFMGWRIMFISNHTPANTHAPVAIKNMVSMSLFSSNTAETYSTTTPLL